MFSKTISSTMKYGLVIGLFFALNFLFSTTKTAYISLLSNVFFILSIVYSYRFAVKFRETENNGIINYSQSLLFIIMLFLYGSIISGGVIFIYIQFINPEFLSVLYNDPSLQESIKLMKTALNLSSEEIEKTLKMFLSPTSYTIQYIWGNTFLGIILGIILSFFIRKGPASNTSVK